jgi:hypothetical protein
MRSKPSKKDEPDDGAEWLMISLTATISRPDGIFGTDRIGGYCDPEHFNPTLINKKFNHPPQSLRVKRRRKGKIDRHKTLHAEGPEIRRAAKATNGRSDKRRPNDDR